MFEFPTSTTTAPYDRAAITGKHERTIEPRLFGRQVRIYPEGALVFVASLEVVRRYRARQLHGRLETEIHAIDNRLRAVQIKHRLKGEWIGARMSTKRGLKDFIDEWRRERPDVDLTAFSIAAAIKQIDLQTEAAFRRLSADFDIGPGDLRILFALRRSGVANPRRPTDLFQSLLVTSGAVTKQVDRLEARGLVERLPDPSHQRGFLIRLTRPGVRVADAAIEAICSNQTMIGAAISALSDQERKAGERFLQRLLAAFEEAGADAREEPSPAPALRRRG